MRYLVCAWALAAGCGDSPAGACDAVDGSCIEVIARSDTVDEIDHLELDLLYGDLHATVTSQADGGRVVGLPVSVAVEIDVTGADAIDVGIVAAGKLSGVVQGTGAGSTSLAPGEHASVDIQLAPAQECVAGSFYCGGDKLAGDPDTLYQCNAGGVPLARGVCMFGCIIRPGDDDTCRGGGGTCVDGGFYCGGDKLDGDPQVLYECSGGAGINGVVCQDGCVVMPPGSDDECR